jgi:3-oxoacyl-[acyl-carrier-protein] synthase II
MQIVGMGLVSSIGCELRQLADLHALEAPEPGRTFRLPGLDDTPFYQGDLCDSVALSAYKLAIKSCRDALRDSGMHSKNVALIVATGAGDTEFMERGVTSCNTPYELAERVATTLALNGVYVTVSNACSSASYALALADDLLAEGHDAVLLCGVEAKSITTQATFKSLLVLDPVSCRPFADNRNGTVLGCGAAALVLIDNDNNQGSQCYAKVRGVSTNCDAYHITSPEPSGMHLQSCIENVLIRAGVEPQQIDIFVPHATGTKLNDEIEKKILKKLFEKKFHEKSTLLVKQYVGHIGGGSAAFSFLIAALKLWNGTPGNDYFEQRFALVNSTAFGGVNSCVILEAGSKA